MRKVLICLTTLTAATFIGCADRDAAQRAAAHTRFTDAVRLVADADQGYVPVGDDKQLTHDRLEDYRRVKLEEAAAQLDPVIATGTTEQRLAARQLMADIHASSSRVALREGMNIWADLANKSASLLTLLTAIDSANARALALQIDDTPLLKKLNDDQVDTRRRLAEYQEARGKLSDRVTDLKTEIEKLTKESDDAIARGRDLRDKAFPLSGDQRYELYNQASDAERESFKVASEAQKLAVNLDVYQSEMLIIDRQIESAEQFLKSIAGQIDDVNVRREKRRQALDQAETDRDALIEELEADVNKLAKQFDTAVDAKLKESLEEISLAVELMKAAVKDASNAKDVQVELLAKMMTQVHVLVSHVMVISDIGRTIDVIATRASRTDHPLMADRQDRFKSVVDRISDRQAELIGHAVAVIESAGELASSLAGGGAADSVGTMADAHVDSLADYRARVKELRLPAVPEGGVPYKGNDISTFDAPAATPAGDVVSGDEAPTPTSDDTGVDEASE